jgi:hypothetical protein
MGGTRQATAQIVVEALDISLIFVQRDITGKELTLFKGSSFLCCCPKLKRGRTISP